MIDRALFALEGIRGALAALVALAVARALLVVGQAWSLASAIVHLWEGAPLPDQAPLIVLFFLCFVGGQLVRYAQDSYLDRYAYARIDALRRELLQAVFGQGARIVQAQGTGSVTAMVLEGIDQVETYLRLILPKIVCVVVVPLIVLLCVFPVDWVSGSIMLVMYPVIVFYMGLIGATAKAAASLQHEEYQRLSNHFIDSMRGIDTLKLFGRGKRHGERIFEVSERFREATVKTLRIATLSGSVLDLISTLSLAAVAIMLGFRLVDGSIAFFPALFVLVLVPEYFKPIREFASDYHASLDGKNALASIQGIIASAEEGASDVAGAEAAASGGRVGGGGGRGRRAARRSRLERRFDARAGRRALLVSRARGAFGRVLRRARFRARRRHRGQRLGQEHAREPVGRLRGSQRGHGARRRAAAGRPARAFVAAPGALHPAGPVPVPRHAARQHRVLPPRCRRR